MLSWPRIYMTDDRAERLATAETTLTKLLLVAPNNAWMHFWMGISKILLTGRPKPLPNLSEL